MENNYLRVRFSKQELKDIGLENVTGEQIRKIINNSVLKKSTINEKEIEVKLQNLEKKLDKMTTLLATYCHQNLILNANNYLNLEKEFEEHNNFAANNYLRTTADLLIESFLLRDSLFPELKIPSFLEKDSKKEQELMNYFKSYKPEKYNYFIQKKAIKE